MVWDAGGAHRSFPGRNHYPFLMKTLLLSLLFVPVLAMAAEETPAKAEKPKAPKPTPEEAFKRHDKDNNGEISLDEFKTGPRGKKDPAKAEEQFKKRDKDANGKLILEEFKSKPAGGGSGKGKGKGAGKGKGNGEKPVKTPAPAPEAAPQSKQSAPEAAPAK